MSMEAKNIKLNYVLSENCVLTERETECISIVSLGYTNVDAAKVINISEGMFKKNIKDIFDKLYVDDRTYAVQKALRYGILTFDMIDRVQAKYNLQPRDVQRVS